MIQTLIALAIVIAAAAWLVLRSLRRPAKGAAAGCGHCAEGSAGRACGPAPLIKIGNDRD